MGNCFGKSSTTQQSQYKSPDEKIRTILLIKQQRDKISQKRDAVSRSIQQAHEMAVKCRKNGQKEQAMYYLGKKKIQSKNLQQINNKLTLVQNSIQTMEQTMDDAEFTQTLKKNNDLIRDLKNQVDTEAIIEAQQLNQEVDFNSQQIQNFINEQELDKDLLDEYANLGDEDIPQKNQNINLDDLNYQGGEGQQSCRLLDLFYELQKNMECFQIVLRVLNVFQKLFYALHFFRSLKRIKKVIKTFNTSELKIYFIVRRFG